MFLPEKSIRFSIEEEYPIFSPREVSDFPIGLYYTIISEQTVYPILWQGKSVWLLQMVGRGGYLILSEGTNVQFFQDEKAFGYLTVKECPTPIQGVSDSVTEEEHSILYIFFL
jgi:hypothetical protein